MGSLRAIRRFGAPCLRRTCVPANPGAEETQSVLDDLWEVLDSGDGVGLAAPQIDRNVRVLVVRDPGKARQRQRLDVVNPEIVGTFGPVVRFEEGCLSFPGLFFDVARPQGVKIAFQDRDGRSCTLEDDGMVSRILQHEMDHLDGRLFIDHLPAWKRWSYALRLAWIRVGGP